MNTNEQEGNREIADLLPFYATGQLPLPEMERVEKALATDAALRRELDLVLEEQAATVQNNEMLGLPSAKAADKLFSMLDAEPARAIPRAPAADLFARFGDWLASLSPRPLAYAGVAAALLVLAQAGAIGVMWQHSGETTFTVASAPGGPTDGSFAVAAFKPEAKLSEITRLLDTANATIVDGPKTGGLYVLRIGPKDMGKADRDRVIAKIAAENSLVRYAAPSQ